MSNNEIRLKRQRALACAIGLSKVVILEQIKKRWWKESDRNAYDNGYCEGLLFAIGYNDMNEVDKEKINDYLNS